MRECQRSLGLALSKTGIRHCCESSLKSFQVLSTHNGSASIYWASGSHVKRSGFDVKLGLQQGADCQSGRCTESRRVATRSRRVLAALGCASAAPRTGRLRKGPRRVADFAHENYPQDCAIKMGQVVLLARRQFKEV
jgi:hypothetical protein